MKPTPELPPAPTRADAVDAALARSRRHRGVPIRNTFVQIQRGAGPLAALVRRGQHNALDLYLVLLLIGTSPKTNHEVTQSARAWSRLVGSESSASSSSQMSRLWSTLEGHKLVEKERHGRHLTVRPLREDGTGQAYSRPSSNFLRVPLEYWSDRWYEQLSLPGKAMLLLALTQRSRFQLTLARVPDWYGFSEDTAQRGMTELEELELISSTEHWELAPLSPTGYRLITTWTLHGAARRYVARAKKS
jgi:hypothetical protein